MSSRQQDTIEQRTIQFKPDLNPEEDTYKTTWVCKQYCLNTTCEIPLNRVRIDREQKQISVQCTIVITTKLDGTLKFHKHEAIREQTDEKWISGRQKTNTKDCEQSPKDNLKHDDGMTTSSHTRDTAGGGRCYFLERRQ